MALPGWVRSGIDWIRDTGETVRRVADVVSQATEPDIIDPEKPVDIRGGATPPSTNASGDGILRRTVQIGGMSIPLVALAVVAFILLRGKL
jgi:hypothetical protein